MTVILDILKSLPTLLKCSKDGLMCVRPINLTLLSLQTGNYFSSDIEPVPNIKMARKLKELSRGRYVDFSSDSFIGLSFFISVSNNFIYSN